MPWSLTKRLQKEPASWSVVWGCTSISHEVRDAMRCSAANDVCILGARYSNPAACEASIECCSFHVREIGARRYRVIQLSLCPPIYAASHRTTRMPPCAELMRQMDAFG